MPTSTLVANEPSTALQTDARAGKYLTFQLSKEEFGIRVLKVREIMGLQEITAVPQTPMHIKGVINLRGKVVPVIDLRLKFGLETAEYTQRTCIIVTQVQSESGSILMGIVVDGVSEVLNLTAQEIEGVGYHYADLAATLARYPIDSLAEGWNTTRDGERYFFIATPSAGLWATREKLYGRASGFGA